MPYPAWGFSLGQKQRGNIIAVSSSLRIVPCSAMADSIQQVSKTCQGPTNDIQPSKLKLPTFSKVGYNSERIWVINTAIHAEMRMSGEVR